METGGGASFRVSGAHRCSFFCFCSRCTRIFLVSGRTSLGVRAALCPHGIYWVFALFFSPACAGNGACNKQAARFRNDSADFSLFLLRVKGDAFIAATFFFFFLTIWPILAFIRKLGLDRCHESNLFYFVPRCESPNLAGRSRIAWPRPPLKSRRLSALVSPSRRSNGLEAPLRVHDTTWAPSEQEPRVALNLELDGAWVDSPASTGGRRWDTSKVMVAQIHTGIRCATSTTPASVGLFWGLLPQGGDSLACSLGREFVSLWDISASRLHLCRRRSVALLFVSCVFSMVWRETVADAP